MIAKVIHNNSVYYSPVFAVSMKRNDCKAVVFDSSFSQLIVLTIFEETRYNILFMDYNTDNFSINEDNLKSYWNDRNIFKTIKHKKYTSEMLQQAREVLSQIKPQEYTTVTSKSDLEALDFNAASFHDAYILAIKEKNDTLEILLDTFGGTFVILKCMGIIKNDLNVGDVFYHCYMEIDNDGIVSFSMSTTSHDEKNILKAKEIQFKPLFEKRIPLKKLIYTIENNELTFECDNQTVKINKTNNDILDFTDRNVLGYFEDDNTIQRCLIFNKDIVYSFYQYLGTNKKPDPKVTKFKEECERIGFVFDNYPLDDYFEESVIDYGELIYSYQYKKTPQLIEIFKVLIPMLFFYNLIILIIQVANPQMRWGFYLTFGLVNSLFTTLISLIATLKNNEHKYIEIYENGVIYYGYNTCFNIDYSNITNVEYNKKIILYTSTEKLTLHKTKNDQHIFELISKRVSLKKKIDEINEDANL